MFYLLPNSSRLYSPEFEIYRPVFKKKIPDISCFSMTVGILKRRLKKNERLHTKVGYYAVKMKKKKEEPTPLKHGHLKFKASFIAE